MVTLQMLVTLYFTPRNEVLCNRYNIIFSLHLDCWLLIFYCVHCISWPESNSKVKQKCTSLELGESLSAYRNCLGDNAVQFIFFAFLATVIYSSHRVAVINVPRQLHTVAFLGLQSVWLKRQTFKKAVIVKVYFGKLLKVKEVFLMQIYDKRFFLSFLAYVNKFCKPVTPSETVLAIHVRLHWKCKANTGSNLFFQLCILQKLAELLPTQYILGHNFPYTLSLWRPTIFMHCWYIT